MPKKQQERNITIFTDAAGGIDAAKTIGEYKKDLFDLIYKDENFKFIQNSRSGRASYRCEKRDDICFHEHFRTIINGWANLSLDRAENEIFGKYLLSWEKQAGKVFFGTPIYWRYIKNARSADKEAFNEFLFDLRLLVSCSFAKLVDAEYIINTKCPSLTGEYCIRAVNALELYSFSPDIMLRDARRINFLENLPKNEFTPESLDDFFNANGRKRLSHAHLWEIFNSFMAENCAVRVIPRTDIIDIAVSGDDPIGDDGKKHLKDLLPDCSNKKYYDAEDAEIIAGDIWKIIRKNRNAVKYCVISALFDGYSIPQGGKGKIAESLHIDSASVSGIANSVKKLFALKLRNDVDISSEVIIRFFRKVTEKIENDADIRMFVEQFYRENQQWLKNFPNNFSRYTEDRNAKNDNTKRRSL